MRKLIFALVLLSAAVPSAIAASAPQWFEIRSPHFVVITDSNEKQARKLAGQFERMRSLFRTVLPSVGGDAGLPIMVLALKDRKGFQSLIPSVYLSKGQIQLDGYFLRTPDRNYILLRLDAGSEHPFSIVYHEYTHFILRKAEWLPLWLNEGLAEFYQNTDILEKDVRLGQPNTDNILYLRQNKLLPLPTLFAVDHNSPYYHDEQKGSVFYAESWALTHFIEITDFEKKTQRLQDYGHFLAQKEDPVLAARHAFGDLGILQKAFENYIANGNYQMFGMKSSFTADDASFTAVPISIGEANAIRADVLASVDRKEEANTLLEAVLRDEPKNALAHETMDSLAFRNHDQAAAKKWYGEAVQLDSESYLANYNFAVFSLMDADTGKDQQIEASLRKAIKLEPKFAPPYDALGHFYALRHKNLEEAHTLSAQAIQLEPQEVRYRINCAQIAMEQQKPADALNILREAAKVARTPADVGLVNLHIQQIQQFQARSEQRANNNLSNTTVETHSSGGVKAIAEPEPEPYPSGPPAGPHLTARGVLAAVHCSYPTVLTFNVDQAGKSVSLYTNNYFKIPFTILNFQATEDLDPCKGIQGMKARVEYTPVSDKRAAGQIVSIELSK